MQKKHNKISVIRSQLFALNMPLQGFCDIEKQWIVTFSHQLPREQADA